MRSSASLWPLLVVKDAAPVDLHESYEKDAKGFSRW